MPFAGFENQVRRSQRGVQAEADAVALRGQLDKERARRLIAESSVEALYESLGSQRNATQQDVAALMAKNSEVEHTMSAKMQASENAFRELSAQQALEGDLATTIRFGLGPLELEARL
jgi:hypothetical protein